MNINISSGFWAFLLYMYMFADKVNIKTFDDLKKQNINIMKHFVL